MKNFSARKGFTLIELLIVVTILATLAVVVFVALNPAQRLADARNSRRISDVQTILTAIHTSIVDDGGTLPSGLTAGMAETQLGTAASGCAVSTGGCGVVATACLDLSTPLAAYLQSMPVDPSLAANSTETDYSVEVDSNGIVTIRACGGELGETISVSR